MSDVGSKIVIADLFSTLRAEAAQRHQRRSGALTSMRGQRGLHHITARIFERNVSTRDGYIA
jgi:hypothetical protein